MEAQRQFHREFLGIQNTHIVHFDLEGLVVSELNPSRFMHARIICLVLPLADYSSSVLANLTWPYRPELQPYCYVGWK